MSLLAPDVHAELAQLLLALQSKDNNVRSQAEDHLQNNWTNTRPEVLLMGLAEQIAAARDTSVCTVHAVVIVINANGRFMTDAFLCGCDFPPHRL